MGYSQKGSTVPKVAFNLQAPKTLMKGCYWCFSVLIDYRGNYRVSFRVSFLVDWVWPTNTTSKYKKEIW